MNVDFLVVGTGLAGLVYALKMADHAKVLILSKKDSLANNSRWAQGGIAAVISSTDSFEQHIQDTLTAGAGLCDAEIVRQAVEEAPDRIQDLVNWGVNFDPHLTKEGGHAHRRILHVQDQTGKVIHETILAKVRQHPNIQILENHFAIDLITNRKTPERECLGAYVLNTKTAAVITVLAKATVLATGGAGKIYLYTTNWEGSTGDGIAMAYRSGAKVANMEFMQFHPTCLHHVTERSFLISEALRGEGAELVNAKGEAFMKKHHPMGSLAPRDIVARSIDLEMKQSGAESVFLDITHRSADFIIKHFPVIYEKCLSLGIDITKQPIPVVPAAHYLCGGVWTDKHGQTSVPNLFAVGETACTGLHGANRLASNSLLECLVFSHAASLKSKVLLKRSPSQVSVPDWVYSSTNNPDEMAVVVHMWNEIRQLMWNYVGIVRSNRRLERAHHRLQNLSDEVREYYWDFHLNTDLLELRNLALVASLSVQSAILRKESRGAHFNLDYPASLSEANNTFLNI
jgi:L-aspartate oxidase